MQQMGGIDVLVNNAAHDYRAEIGALDVGRMKTMFETNVFGLVDITNRVVPQMKERKSGDIINIASTSGMKGAATAHALCREQVGGARYLAVLAGGAAAARHPRRSRSARPKCRPTSAAETGRNNPNKLYAADIAGTIVAALDMPRRVLWPELAVFASNPWQDH